MNTTPDWSKFTRIIYINTSVENLYNCWTTQNGLQNWFLKTTEFYNNGNKRKANENCKPGDTYIWKWHNWNGQEEGKVVTANGQDKLVIEFANSIVSIDLYNSRGKVCVELKQTNIPTDNQSKYNIHHGCSCGWSFWLTNLKAWTEYGITLNDKEEGLENGLHCDMDIVNI